MFLALFNIFIDDTVEELRKHNCDPVNIGSTGVNCLLYANDIVLLSESKQDVQTSLNVISKYWGNWKLHVNVSKSEVVFNSNNRSYLNEFTYNSNVTQTVQKCCFLGVQLQFNGKFDIAVYLLIEKAKKALFKVKQWVGQAHPYTVMKYWG